jgi:hypothetical protein
VFEECRKEEKEKDNAETQRALRFRKEEAGIQRHKIDEGFDDRFTKSGGAS